ncbi:hypothetical protein N0V83_003030 [Neocucurbitaria cava]|uniref:Uncharacterized protein n=1 Tax=Neocucurbitaria cava TaxID=798079 RepID=A0A9W8YD73_9PLEO|nr:hypothetical protein N0V83_003030 [Neocucurbitaria cava]
MTTNPRLLFPDLPPELRNEIYNYLSVLDNSSSPTNTSLPFQPKTYECKHTTVQICPVQIGPNGLLALRKYGFQEAFEYQSWLLKNKSELKIAVTFKGRVNTFVQADWDKKMEMHLRKLAKQYPWMKKVAKYDIHILWRATDGPLKSRKNRRTSGQIPKDMAETLTGLMEEHIKQTRGEVNVRLCLGHALAVENIMSSTKLGLSNFLCTPSSGHEVRRMVKEVWKGPPLIIKRSVPGVPLAGLREVGGVLQIEKGLVKWVSGGEEILVMKKTMVQGNALEMTIGEVQQENGLGVDYVLQELVEECLGRQ